MQGTTEMKNLIIIVFSVLYLSLFQPIQLFAQDDNMAGFKKYVSSQSIDSLQSINPLKYKKMDEEQLEKLEYNISLQKYYRESLVNRNKAFTWSHTSSVIIFWMVITIMFFGLIFSAIQFYISMLNAKHQIQNKVQSETDKEETPGPTTLKISLSGLEVNSSVLGIIILVISLAFFYLYLVHVYPVKEYNIENKIIPEVSTNVKADK